MDITIFGALSATNMDILQKSVGIVDKKNDILVKNQPTNQTLKKMVVMSMVRKTEKNVRFVQDLVIMREIAGSAIKKKRQVKGPRDLKNQIMAKTIDLRLAGQIMRNVTFVQGLDKRVGSESRREKTIIEEAGHLTEIPLIRFLKRIIQKTRKC